eukprot:SAG31_NODE_1106_length_9878_cov_4.621331_17_plen_225_part_00
MSLIDGRIVFGWRRRSMLLTSNISRARSMIASTGSSMIAVRQGLISDNDVETCDSLTRYLPARIVARLPMPIGWQVIDSSDAICRAPGSEFREFANLATFYLHVAWACCTHGGIYSCVSLIAFVQLKKCKCILWGRVCSAYHSGHSRRRTDSRPQQDLGHSSRTDDEELLHNQTDPSNIPAQIQWQDRNSILRLRSRPEPNPRTTRPTFLFADANCRLCFKHRS